MHEKDALYHLGPNQRLILELLKKRPNLTVTEIAKVIYRKPVVVGSNDYSALSRSLRALLKKGLIERTIAEVLWHLPEKKD